MRWRALLAAVLVAACRPQTPERRLVVAYPAGPTTLVPFASNEEFTTSILNNVYEGLTEMDDSLALRPGLAESWHTSDDVTWVFLLREGVRFHDGRPLDSRHVVASLETARNDPRSRRRAELTSVAALEAPDPRTVVIRTRHPFGPLPNRLANIWVWAEPASPDQPPAGTGPYRLRQAREGGDTALEAFAEYRGGRPAIREVAFKVVPEQAERLRGLKAGELDLVVDVPPDALGGLQESPSVRVVPREGLRVLYLGMDTGRARTPHVEGRNPFQDVRVRRAVALAIDREALVKGPLGGYARVVDQLVAPEVYGYHDGLPSRPYDLAEARRLLREAGFGAGFRVGLDFMPAKYRAMEAVAAALAADLARAGISVDLRPCDSTEFFRRVEGRDTSFYLMGWLANSGDAGLTYEYLLHTPGGGRGQDNGGGYSNPEVDRHLQTASGWIRPEQRRPLVRAVAEIVQQDVPVIPLYRQTDIYAVDRALEFHPRLDRRVRASSLRWASPAR